MEGVANGQVGIRVNQRLTGTPAENFTTFDFVLNSSLSEFMSAITCTQYSIRVHPPENFSGPSCPI